MNLRWWVKPLPRTQAIIMWLVIGLLLLSTCDFGPDIDILEVNDSAEPVVMVVSAGPGLTSAEVAAWVSEECRNYMILPPLVPVVVQVRQLARPPNRIEYRFRCERP